LSHFIGLAQQNEHASFANKKNAYRLISNIDDIYHGLGENLINTKQVIPAMLYLRAHSAYRAGVRLALSGEVAESFLLGRSCIEYSLYAFHISSTQEAGTIWLQRHESEEIRKQCRREFTHKNVLATLQSVDSDLAELVADKYEQSIDFGGHPNERAVTSALQFIETDKGINLKQLYLVGDSPSLDHGLQNIADVGLAGLYILRRIWPERFNILGITEKLKRFRWVNSTFSFK